MVFFLFLSKFLVLIVIKLRNFKKIKQWRHKTVTKMTQLDFDFEIENNIGSSLAELLDDWDDTFQEPSQEKKPVQEILEASIDEILTDSETDESIIQQIPTLKPLRKLSQRDSGHETSRATTRTYTFSASISSTSSSSHSDLPPPDTKPPSKSTSLKSSLAESLKNLKSKIAKKDQSFTETAPDESVSEYVNMQDLVLDTIVPPGKSNADFIKSVKPQAPAKPPRNFKLRRKHENGKSKNRNSQVRDSKRWSRIVVEPGKTQASQSSEELQKSKSLDLLDLDLNNTGKKSISQSIMTLSKMLTGKHKSSQNLVEPNAKNLKAPEMVQNNEIMTPRIGNISDLDNSNFFTGHDFDTTCEILETSQNSEVESLKYGTLNANFKICDFKKEIEISKNLVESTIGETIEPTKIPSAKNCNLETEKNFGNKTCLKLPELPKIPSLPPVSKISSEESFDIYESIPLDRTLNAQKKSSLEKSESRKFDVWLPMIPKKDENKNKPDCQIKVKPVNDTNYDFCQGKIPKRPGVINHKSLTPPKNELAGKINFNSLKLNQMRNPPFYGTQAGSGKNFRARTLSSASSILDKLGKLRFRKLRGLGTWILAS